MEHREILYTVTDEGRVSPSTRQWGGVQYEDNITDVAFDVSTIDLVDMLWRIDFDSPEAGYDPGDLLDVTDGLLKRAIPYKMTRFGGEMQVTLVGTHMAEGDAPNAVAYSIPVKVYFTEVERHEETEDQAARNVSASEKAAKDAAEEAERSKRCAEEAVEAIKKTQDSVDAADKNTRQSAEEAAASALLATQHAANVEIAVHTAQNCADLAGAAAQSADDSAKIASKASDEASDRAGEAKLAADKATEAMETITGVSGVVANALKGSASGSAVTLADVSPLEHEMSVKVRGVADLSAVTVSKIGKNILPYPYIETTVVRNGITFTDNGDGTITANGTATHDAYFILSDASNFGQGVDLGKAAAFSGCPQGGSADTYHIYSIYTGHHDVGAGVVMNTPRDTYLQLRIRIKAGVTVNNLVFKPQVEFNSIVTEYTPFVEEEYTPDADGVVEGVTSLYPTTTLQSDTDGVMIDVEYNRDINKAFAELEQKITALSAAVLNV